jgi:hypothetical protein
MFYQIFFIKVYSLLNLHPIFWSIGMILEMNGLIKIPFNHLKIKKLSDYENEINYCRTVMYQRVLHGL